MVDAALIEPKWLTTGASWSSAYPDHDLHCNSRYFYFSITFKEFA